MVEIPYDANCLTCRREAGKQHAGVTRECRAHEVLRLTRERDEAQARLQQSIAGGMEAVRPYEGERECRKILDRRLDECQRERDTLRALLREVWQAYHHTAHQGWAAVIEYRGASDGEAFNEWLARVDAALEGRDDA